MAVKQTPPPRLPEELTPEKPAVNPARAETASVAVTIGKGFYFAGPTGSGAGSKAGQNQSVHWKGQKASLQPD